MAKLTILATSFALLFFIATASVTITTVEIEEENGQSNRGCQEQIRGMSMRNCEQFLMECPMHRMKTRGGSRCQEMRQECCEDMEKMDEQCRCAAIKKMVQKQQGPQMERMVEKAMKLPQMCGMGPEHCQMRAFWY